MSMHFLDLCNEVKRRATRDQSGTTFDTGIKNAVNFSIYRIARDAPWRSLRRKTTFDTVTSYTKGTGYATMTSGSTTVSVTGATFITDDIEIGRKVKMSQSGTYYTIETIPSETSFTIDKIYSSSTSTGGTYEILPQEEYVLPVQAGHRIFMWHEEEGCPKRMSYITDLDFYNLGAYLTTKGTPTHYRMWGEDMALMQPRQPSVLTLSSSDSSDTNIPVTVFGTVSGYPDYEIITTNASNGTTSVAGTKSFSKVERVTKNGNTEGRITITANYAQDTISVLPVGDTTSGPLYRKIQLYPLPDTVFPITLQYYKYPYRLVGDGDVHELGEDFDEAIILHATGKIKAEANLAEADRFFVLWQDEMRSLKRTNIDKFDWFPTLRRPGQSGGDALVSKNLLFSQAGSYFGPSSRL